MTEIDFRKALEIVWKDILEPLGFTLRTDRIQGVNMYSFTRPSKSGRVLHGIGIYPRRSSRAFAVELGVVPVGGDLFDANYSEKGAWRELGLRLRLGKLVQGDLVRSDATHRDFVFYENETDLGKALRHSLALALEHGATVWPQLEGRLKAIA